MRLLVTGGRHLDDVAAIVDSLNLIHRRHPLSVLIHGGHAFLGAVAEDWARDHALHVLRYPPNWRTFGRRAESIRNDFMLSDSRPDLLLALPGGNDTRLLIIKATAQGLPVFGHDCGPFDHGDPPPPDPEPALTSCPGRPAPRLTQANLSS